MLNNIIATGFKIDYNSKSDLLIGKHPFERVTQNIDYYEPIITKKHDFDNDVISVCVLKQRNSSLNIEKVLDENNYRRLLN